MKQNTTDQFLETLRVHARATRMRPRIRDQVRERLIAYADLHAVEAVRRQVRVVSLWTMARMPLFRASAFALAFLVLSGSVAYASEGSLPGDVLYGVKVHVTEPLEGNLYGSVKKQAGWHAELAERRLAEAIALSQDHRLTEAARTLLAERFVAESQQSSNAADALVAEGKLADALTVRSDLEARVDAHGDLLALLATHGNDKEAGTLLASVEVTHNEIEAKRQHDATALAITDEAAPAADVAMATRDTDSVATLAFSTGTDLFGAVQSRIEDAHESLSDAKLALDGHKNGDAYVAADDATRSAHEASILVKHKDIIIALGSTPDAEQDGAAPAAVTVPSGAPVLTAAIATSSSTTTDATTTIMSVTTAKGTTMTVHTEVDTAAKKKAAVPFSLPSLPILPKVAPSGL